MTELGASQPAGPAPSRPTFFPLLLGLFIGSGCSALIYEIVWFQLLELVIGSSAVSLGVLLGTYMGGMCLGSLALPRVISARRHPLRVYALLELGIGAIGIALLFGMPSVDHLYAANIGHGLPAMLLRGAVCALCLLPPTLLMGGTLPAVARWVESTPRGMSWLGLLYGGNIAGAVLGCLLAGFYLLRVHDVAIATYVAAGGNGAMALVALLLAARAPHAPPADATTPQRPPRAPAAWSVYVAIALSGLTALAAEVIWTRVLSLMLGPTVYSFSLILAVFLAGLGIGSSAGAFLSRTVARPQALLGACQMLLAAALAWAAYTMTQSLPYWPIDPGLSSSPWHDFQLDILRCAWAVLPPACLWGASFPLALAAVAAPGRDPGRLVGGVYAANTVGAIVGSIAFSIVLVPWIGTQQSQRLLVVLSALAGILVFVPLVRPSKAAIAAGWPTRRRAGAIARAACLAVAGGVAGLLAWRVPAVSPELIAYGRFLPAQHGSSRILYMGEGMNASVAVSELSDGVRNFHISGKVEASSHTQDMRLQRMLGHLSALLHPKPRSVLVVGCGAGVTAGTFVLHPDVQRIVICELEPLVPPLAAKYFGHENYDVVSDPRVQVIYDDARHYVLTTREKFDIITSDPIHPWVKGSATLYSTEYFQLCKRRLNPGGLVTQWVPLYESDLETVRSEMATFFEVFPKGTIWSNDVEGEGYDVVLLGQAGDTRIDVDRLEERLAGGDHVRVADSLYEVGFESAIDLLATYAGQAPDLETWLEGAQINRDRNLRLQYLAGMALNLRRGQSIFDSLLAYRKFPKELFAASERRRQALMLAIGAR